MAAGLDSMAAIELKNAVAARFEVTVPVTIAFDYPSIRALAGFVSANLPTASSSLHQGELLPSGEVSRMHPLPLPENSDSNLQSGRSCLSHPAFEVDL